MAIGSGSALATQLHEKIAPEAKITTKQFNFMRDLAAQRDWSTAPTELSIAIKQVARAATHAEVEQQVPRKTASSAISFLLSPQAPKVAASAQSAASAPSQVTWGGVQTTLAAIPTSKYAIESTKLPGTYVFFEIVQRKNGTRFVNKLQGAPGDWKRIYLTPAQALKVAEKVAENPTAHATKYCEIFTRCSACDSPLSNAKSIAEAMGPVCRKKFKW